MSKCLVGQHLTTTHDPLNMCNNRSNTLRPSISRLPRNCGNRTSHGLIDLQFAQGSRIHPPSTLPFSRPTCLRPYIPWQSQTVWAVKGQALKGQAERATLCRSSNWILSSIQSVAKQRGTGTKNKHYAICGREGGALLQ